MSELKDTERELHQFRVRLSVIAVFIFLCFGILFARFAWLQV